MKMQDEVKYFIIIFLSIIFIPIIIAIIKSIIEKIKKRNKIKYKKIAEQNENEIKKLKKEILQLKNEKIELCNKNMFLTQKYEEQKNESTPTYTKKSLLTNYEKQFYTILKNNFEQNYLLQSQVNLLSIINKNTNEKYRNELFRNIDFGIFDKNTLEPLVMIEINDKTHKEQERYKRDLKVREILKESNIPLITFYSDYPNKENYIVKKINEVLKNG